MSVTPFKEKSKKQKEAVSLAMAHLTLRSINCPLVSATLFHRTKTGIPFFPRFLSRVGLACTVVQPLPRPDYPPDATGALLRAPRALASILGTQEAGHEPVPHEPSLVRP